MHFQLKVVDTASRIAAIELEAADEAGARLLASKRGYAVLSVSRGTALLPRLAWSRHGFSLTLFSIELLALLDAGLNVVEALQALAEKEQRADGKKTLEELLRAIRQGESLSLAMERFPRDFPPLYVATIRSSERTGSIRETLSRYGVYQEERDRVRNKIVSALLYPAILLVVGTLVLAFLLLYVVPRFARVYESISSELPLFSSLLLIAGRWIDHHGTLVLALLIAGGAALAYAFAQDGLRARIAGRLWQIPALGARLHTYQLARLYRTVGMLLRAGIPALQAFEMVSGLLAPNMRTRLTTAISQLREGRSISAVLSAAGLATGVADRMLAVGERSGRMGELMERIARFYDDDTARFADTFTRIFEPLLMAILGLGVGLVVVLMYMPIFELAGSIQ